MSFRIERSNRAVLDARDRGFLLGDGVFDTMGSAGGAVHRLEAHRRRLLRAADAIGLPLDRAALVALQAAVLDEVGDRPAIIRTTVSRGSASRGLWPATPPEPTILVTAEPWPMELLGRPVRLHVAGIVRNERSPLSRIKSLSALETVLAAREAASAGCDEALLVNSQGRLACSAIANVVLVDGDTLLTPPLSEGCLDGIVRETVLEEAAIVGLAAREEPVALPRLLACDGAALTNSIRLLRPVLAVGGTPLPRSPRLEALARRLKERVFNRTSVP